jgi:hypothetical protein
MIPSSHSTTTYSSVVPSSGTVQYLRGEAKILNCLYTSYGFTEADCQYIVANYDVIVFNCYEYAATYPLVASGVARLKQLKPDLVILMYISAISASPTLTWYMNWSEVNSHENWFLHDIYGNRLQISWSSGWYGIDPANAAWRAYLGDYCYRKMSEIPGIDGVFIDNVWWQGFKDLWTVPRADLPSNYGLTWYADMKGLLAYIKSRIGTKLVIPNTIDTADFVDVSDGMMAEGFVHYEDWDVNTFGPFGYPYQDLTYPQQLARFKSVLDRGKYFLAIDSASNIPSQADAERVFYYCFCSILLITNEKASFMFTTWNYLGSDSFGLLELTKNAEPLGQPTGDYYSLTNCLARDFENGRVIVNYNPYSTTINLGGNFRTLDGAVLNQITLAPDTGLILYKV